MCAHAPPTHHDGVVQTSDTRATLVTVAYRTRTLDLAWVPVGADVIVVHNDDFLDRSALADRSIRHLGDGSNIGFGRGVNVALQHISAARVILANPDTHLGVEHWEALAEGTAKEIMVIPLVDAHGDPTSVVNRYPTPTSLVLTALRLGQWFGRQNRLRRALVPLLGSWGADHARSLTSQQVEGRWAITTHWPSAAACSFPTELLRRVQGFDPGYFLYLEDADLARRQAVVDPELEIVQPAMIPGVHLVSASSRSSAGRRRANLEQARSALRYASKESGAAWGVARAIVRTVGWWRGRS